MVFRERNSRVRNKKKHGGSFGIRKDSSQSQSLQQHSRPKPRRVPFQRLPTDLHHQVHRQDSRYFSNLKYSNHPLKRQRRSEQQTPTTVTDYGHRGFAHLSWRRVPREPPVTVEDDKLFSVFVDGLHEHMAKQWLVDVFSECGRVKDAFISAKKRKFSKDGFGFVRFGRKVEALAAIEKFDGMIVKGKTMRVSMAKFNKMGQKFREKENGVTKKPIDRTRNIKNPAFRDGRSYKQVVTEKQSKNQEEGRRNFEKEGNQQHHQKKNTEAGSIPAGTRYSNTLRFALRLDVSETMATKLAKAVVVKLDDDVKPKDAAFLVEKYGIKVEYMASLSHDTMVLFFEDDEEKDKALSNSSVLRSLFTDVRKWSERQVYDERIASCIECHGLNPICWSPENYLAIGEKWGKVIHVEHERDGVTCLTYARLFVITRNQQRIEACINMEWASGSCHVWVREVNGCNLKPHETGGTQNNNEVNSGLMERWAVTQNEELRGGHRKGIMEEGECLTPLSRTQQLLDDEVRNGGSTQPVTNVQGYGVTKIVDVMENNVGNETVGVLENGQANQEVYAVSSNTEKELNMEDISLDEMVIGHYSCPVQYAARQYDPMLSIEAPLSLNEPKDYETEAGFSQPMDASANDPMKRRGRPRRKCNSLPVPLSVQSTPTQYSIEAVETWRRVKLVGANTPNDGELISELRKSKRIQSMEANNRACLEV
ncbi:unnamed protein product [Amaranthus hypochondriacus]